MKTFQCQCNGALFFENTGCLACGREVGWCPSCRNISALDPDGQGAYTCMNTTCGQRLVKCHNYAIEMVCNRCLACEEGAAAGALCDYCIYTERIPDLSFPENRQRWYRLEVAKRRLLYSLDLLQLPYGHRDSGFPLPLSFAFLADAVPTQSGWQPMGDQERVYTGHANGKITINLQEADSSEREKFREKFGESHRTLIGHFRHEIGH